MSAAAARKWEERYSSTEYVYGTEPNDFLVESVPPDRSGPALCLADGEGRNGVYLASLGYTVTSVDRAQSGMIKAAKLAESAGVALETVVADLDGFDLGRDKWDLIVSVFAHTPPDVRRRLHSQVAASLTPGGLFILEAYTPDQVGRGTGGPPTPELTMTLEALRDELVGLHIVSGREVVRSVIEGPGHTGDGAVVQVVATRA